MSRANILLLLLAGSILAAPLLLPGLSGQFEGTDSQAQALLEHQGYRPWFTPLWTPPSDEAESLLFALQAALGAGIFGYVLGRRQGRKKPDDAS